MIAYELRVETPVDLEITGKFLAPSPDWIHMSRILLDYELIVMTEGVLYLAGDQQHFTVAPGEYLLLPPHTRQYGYRASSCSFYWLHFRTPQPVQSLDLTAPPGEPEEHKLILPQYGELKSPEKIIVLMKQLQDCVRGYNQKTLNNYMSTAVLCELYSQVFHSVQHPPRKTKQEQLYNDIVDYIKWSRSQQIKVSQIADYFGYNEKYLSHLFTTISGTSLKQFILQQRMELAKFLLTDTNRNITEVSQELGYKDAHNFMKSFKKIVGLTPSEYRNAYAKRLLFYE